MSYGYTLLSETFPVARKQHRCIWCGEAIPVGMKHRHEKSVYDGNMQDFRWHDECVKAQKDDILETGECEFAAYENERPAPGVPEAQPAAPECETCRGVGTIDERLGGYSFSNHAATCPDCDGTGEGPAGVAPIHGGKTE